MKITHILTLGAIALAAVGATSDTAMADATVTSNVSVSSTGGPNGARQHSDTVTVYYQGDNIRIESANGAVMMYTGGKLYRINAANQTYSLMPAPPRPPGAPPANGNDTLSLTTTGDTSTLAGQSAAEYTIAGSGPAGPPPRSQQGGGGSQGGNDFGGAPSGPPPSASMTGQVWLSDAVKIDSGAQDALTIALGHSFDLRGPIAHALATKLVAVGDAPLSANITITMPAAPDGTTATTTYKSTATSISTGTLDASLFAIPSGYTQVAFQRGGPGGGGPGGGQAGGGGMNDFGNGPAGPPPGD